MDKSRYILDNEHWTILKTSNNKAICLICMENISFSVDISSHERLTSHLISDAHKIIVQSLFEECFSKPANTSKSQHYSEFISNLVFDTTLYLGNEPSYVSQIGSHVVCLMCSEKLFEACSEERSVDIMLIDHLKSEQHFKNLKSWACWNYFFEDNSGFLMISQSRVFCSLCKKTIVVGGDSLFGVLNSHLWNNHNLDLAKRVKELKMCNNSSNEQSDQNDSPRQNADAINENGVQVQIRYEQELLKDAKYDLILEKGLGQTLQRSSESEDIFQVVENLHYPNEDPVNVNKSDVSVYDYNIHPTESNIDTKSNSSGNQSDYCKSRNLEEENSRINLESSFGFHFDDVNAENKRNDDINVNESANNLFETQETSGDIPGASSGDSNYDDGSESDSEPTDTEDYDDALEALTCPTCGCFVEVLNEDAEFSLKLHCQIHNDLTSINTDEKLEFNENVEYVCPICHEAIQLFNKDIELSVQRHFEERKTDHEGFGFVKSNGVSPDSLSKTFSSFTEPVKKYEKFILLGENKFLCKLCNCELPVDIKNISKILLDHLSNAFHEEQYKSLSQNLTMVVLDYNNQYKNDQPNVELDLLDQIINKHPLIQQNRQFIEKKGIHYFCKVCQKQINHALSEHTLALNFMFHLRGPSHITASKAFVKSSSEKCLVQRIKKEKGPQKQIKSNMRNTLSNVSRKSVEVSMNQYYFKIKMATSCFHCVVCNAYIEFPKSESKLISHCSSTAHNEILTRNASFVVPGHSNTNETNHAELKIILDSLASFEFLKAHVQFIIGDEQGCWCIVCEVKIPLFQKNIREHIFGNNHKNNSFKVQLQMIRKNKPAKVKDPKEVARKTLAQLLEYSPLVGMNSKFIDVSNDQFFCKLCHARMKCSSKGKDLKSHLNSANHRRMMSKRFDVSQV